MKTLSKLVAAAAAAVWCLCAAVVPARADEKVVFEANANMFASTGEAFRIEFSLNAEPEKDSFVPPTFDGFDVVAGPVESRGRSIQIVNGSMTNSVNYTVSYVLLPQQAGQFRIGAAEIAVKGTKYRTGETMVEVRERGSTGEQTPAGGGGQNESLERAAENQVAADDLMLRLTLSRTEVYPGEPVRARLRLYSRVNVVGSEGAKMPVFNGFWSQQLDIERASSRETVGGRVYETYDIAEYILYPQQNGTLTIDPAELTVVVQVVVPGRRGFDPFFGGNEIYHVRRNLVSPRVSLRVKELPAGAPWSFSGAVGKFKMESNRTSIPLTANSASTVVLRISGSGNLNFIQAPKVEGVGPFEFYDVKSSEQIRNTAAGSTGYRQFEYPFIIRAQGGEHIIHLVEFSYFDPESESYVTLYAGPWVIAVTPDSSANTSPGVVTAGTRKEDVRLLGSDIRYIKFGDIKMTKRRNPLIFSPLWFAILALTAVAGAAAHLLVRKRIRDRGNTALMKGRRANKVAVQRFRAAERYMKEHDRRAFYEEMLRALWGYMSDRFNIPVSDLTKESIREELARRGAGDEAKRVTDIITECEEAQYSPVARVRMEESYAEGIDIISRIESAIKR